MSGYNAQTGHGLHSPTPSGTAASYVSIHSRTLLACDCTSLGSKPKQ